MPPVEEYLEYVRKIFDSHQLTNHGGCVSRLEEELGAFLDSPTLLAVSNGTVALQLAIRHLGMAGKKVITTPFTYVATTSALLWEGCDPVFADIDPDTFCMAPKNLEQVLERHPDAAGIMPVHVFGNAADVEAIDSLAKSQGIPVLYDAAHAFGCRLNGKSLFAYGDAVCGSFHATKLFHTIEGGCIASPKGKDASDLRLLHAFGHDHDYHIMLGINAKMSEMHAAMGLCLLPKIDDLIRKRAAKTRLYDQLLEMDHDKPWRGIHLSTGLQWNHAYYPIVLENGEALHKTMSALEAEDIHPRRYFYPSLTKLPYVKEQSCPVSEDIADRILCLPLWPDMDDNIIEKVAKMIKYVNSNRGD